MGFVSSTGGEETGVVKKENSNDTRRNPETTGDIYVACDLEEQGVSVGEAVIKCNLNILRKERYQRLRDGVAEH